MATPIPTPEDTQSWTDTIRNFKGKVAEFMGLYNDLKQRETSIGRYPVDVQTRYRDLMNRGDTIKNTVAALTQKVDQVWAWMKKQAGFGDDGLKGLGFVQFIPIAVVVGSVAAMGKWVKDAYVQKRAFDSADAMIAKGVPPERAYASVTGLQQALDKPLFDLGKIGPVLVILGVGGALWYFARRAKG